MCAIRVEIRRRIFPLVLLVLLPLLLALPGHAQDGGLQETFDDPALPGWDRSPEAAVAGGVLHIEPGGFALHDGEWGDMTLSVRVRRSGESMVMLRYRIGDSGDYSVLLEPGGMTLARAHVGELAVASVSLPSGEWVQVDVMVSGGTHQVTLNGAVVLSAARRGQSWVG
jgi:hypothetical protein